jgi:hypothetical protein
MMHSKEILESVPMPERIAALPQDPERHYPVPFFVAWIDGKPDFRIADEEKRIRCIKEKLCWICGEKLGRYQVFVIGPMCAINRISAEPPMHRDCAEYSVRVCPFLLNPNQKRNPKKVDAELGEPPGIAIMRNPGCMLIWITTGYTIVRDQVDRVLFGVGPPVKLAWIAEGRSATRAEVLESIETGLPILRELAAKQGSAAERALENQLSRAIKLIPIE